MHARKTPPALALPNPPRRILGLDDQVPQLHRTVVESALSLLDRACMQIDEVCAKYTPSDPRVRELREMGTRLDMVLFVGQQWLTWHDAAKGGKR